MASSTTNLDTISSSQAQKEVTANALFDAASPSMVFARRASACAALTWGYYGGVFPVAGVPTAIANGTITLTASATNYLYATSAGVVTKVTSAPTGWPGPITSPAGAIALYAIAVGASSVTSYTDYRVTGGGSTPVMVGDSGSGGAQGSAPAPGAGDAASGKYLSAAGIWGVPAGTGESNVAASFLRYSIAQAASTTPGQVGFTFSNGSTSGGRSNANYLASLARILISSTSTGNTGSVLNSSSQIYWLGDAAGRGGFDVEMVFGIEVNETTLIAAVGLFGQSGNLTANGTNPSTLTDRIFMGTDQGDTNMQIMHNDAAGTCTKIDLGASFPKTSPATYKVRFSAASNGSTVNYVVTRLDSAASASGTLSTNLPANTTFLNPQFLCSKGAVATVVSVDFISCVGRGT